MLGFSIAFVILSIMFMCILSAVRGWKAYSILPVILFLITILMPFDPSLTILWTWWFAITVCVLPMIWYGERGRVAFEDFFKNDIAGYIEKFQKWNQ